MSALRIARLTTLDEFELCVHIQSSTWQYSAGELFPRRAFLLADRIGGHVLGAWDRDSLVAFNLAYPGLSGRRPYLHSQMLAVLPAYRNAGAGRALKWAQRELALRQGIELIQWTFDPLEIKNAFFNISRLGAVSRGYVRDFYGPSSSPLQGALPTDRLYAEWWVASERVAEVAKTGSVPAEAVELTVDVPGEIYAWRAAADPRAAAAQERLRQQFAEAFAAGLMVSGYRRGDGGNGRYLLSRAPLRSLEGRFHED